MTEREALDALKAAAVEMAEMEAAHLRLRDDSTAPALQRLEAFRDSLSANIAYYEASRTYARTLKEPHV